MFNTKKVVKKILKDKTSRNKPMINLTEEEMEYIDESLDDFRARVTFSKVEYLRDLYFFPDNKPKQKNH